ncbi:MAG TPA: hypothetical protein VH482_04375, partial [Thermomicrobiales bacterium]
AAPQPEACRVNGRGRGDRGTARKEAKVLAKASSGDGRRGGAEGRGDCLDIEAGPGEAPATLEGRIGQGRGGSIVVMPSLSKNLTERKRRR